MGPASTEGAWTRRLTPALACLVAFVAALGSSAGPAGAADRIALRDSDSAGVRAYWTPERMRAATPAQATGPEAGPLPGGGVAARGGPTVVGPTAAGSAEVAELEPGGLSGRPQMRAAGVTRDEITDPSAEPFRSHGKVFFTISGGSAPGNYVCSGTAVASNNRSVVWTAGHCVFDSFGGGYATNWMFAPGYRNGATPFGVWPAVRLATTRQWREDENLSYDLGAAEVSINGAGQPLTELVGGRGIGFNQLRAQNYESFGYPAKSPPLEFTGGREFRCTATLGGTDNPPGTGPDTSWIPCDMTGGSSGGGWVVAGILLGLNSYSYCAEPTGTACEQRLYGPYLDSAAEALYRSVAGEAAFCGGLEVTHLGTSGADRLVGSAKRDVFKAFGGADTIIGRGGDDIVCAGGGKDRIDGKAGSDQLKGQRGGDVIRGGRGRDSCNGGGGRDSSRGCERRKQIP